MMTLKGICSAAALFLAAASTANAATYVYSVTDDSGVVASGDFTTDASNDITAFTGALTGAFFAPTTGAISFTPNADGSNAFYSPSGFFIVDDVYNPTAAPGANLDVDGILFSVAGSEYNLWGNGVGAPYTLENNQGVAESVSFSAAAVPEPATWAMMFVGFGGLGVAMRNSRRKLAVAAV
jgi:hypothetical protein